MCGIVGVMQLRPGREPVRPEALGRMRDTLAHRGPDGAGLWISPDGRGLTGGAEFGAAGQVA